MTLHVMVSKHTIGLIVPCYDDVKNAIKLERIFTDDVLCIFLFYNLLSIRSLKSVFILNIYFVNAVKKANIINVHVVMKLLEQILKFMLN